MSRTSMVAGQRDVRPDPPPPDTVRCKDLDAWHRCLTQAPGLASTVPDAKRASGVRTVVSAAVVKLVGFAMRAYMDGPSKPQPGTNAHPGVGRLAEELELSQRQVAAALTRLVEAQFLVQTHRGYPGQKAQFSAALPGPLARSLIQARRLKPASIGPVEIDGEPASGRTLSEESLRLDTGECASGRTLSEESLRLDTGECASGRTQEPASGRTPTSALDLRSDLLQTPTPLPPTDAYTDVDGETSGREGGDVPLRDEDQEPDQRHQDQARARLVAEFLVEVSRKVYGRHGRPGRFDTQWQQLRTRRATERMIGDLLDGGSFDRHDLLELLTEELDDVDNVAAVIRHRVKDLAGRHRDTPLVAAHRGGGQTTAWEAAQRYAQQHTEGPEEFVNVSAIVAGVAAKLSTDPTTACTCDGSGWLLDEEDQATACPAREHGQQAAGGAA